MTVLDTHVWIWWASDPARLSSRARKAIERAVEREELRVSSISAWEMAMLVKQGRLRLKLAVEDWIAYSEALPFLDFVPVTHRIAVQSVRLPEPLHADPADRIIIATALSLGARLVTKDDRIRAYPHVDTVW